MNAVRGSNVYPFRAGTSTSAPGTPTLRLKWSGSSGGDGGMDDILRRLHTVETTVSDIKTQVGGLIAVVPHLATKADVAEVKGYVAEVKGSISSLESSLIKWIVGTALAVAALAFAIARFVAPAGS